MSTSNLATPPDLTVISRLACPKCRGALTPTGEASVTCASCEWSAGWVGNVINVLGESPRADFDSLHETMERNNSTDVIHELMYRQQIELLESMMRPGTVMADIGCGPRVLYDKPAGIFLIGVEPSLDAISKNRTLDLGIRGSATSLPIPSGSVDLIVCFYSVHHMIGGTVAETMHNVERAFAEFSRVLKPDGQLIVFEVCPWQPFATLQRWFWGAARAIFGQGWNFFFWRQGALVSLGRAYLPKARWSARVFSCSPWALFNPFFAISWLKVPRFLYPFSMTAMSWTGSRADVSAPRS
jgi:SAM-dependent methyltransferase